MGTGPGVPDRSRLKEGRLWRDTARRMSQANVDNLRRGFEQFLATGEFSGEFTPDFVWDMSTFQGWPERQTYEGVEGAREFMADWLEAWEDWQLEVEQLIDAGDDVVALVRQRGRSKTTGLTVDMEFAQVWTFRDGAQARMRMYASHSEALEAAGHSG
jgi:ketosteroid isomerase-like protein